MSTLSLSLWISRMKNAPSSPNCSYLSALLPVPHQSVPGNIQERFLRVCASVPSLRKILVNFGGLEETSAHGASGASSILILNTWGISWSCAPRPSQRARYLSVTGELRWTSHVTNRMSSDQRLRYRERTPARSSRRNVTRVSPSPAGFHPTQVGPVSIPFCAIDNTSDDKAKRSNRQMLCISIWSEWIIDPVKEQFKA